MTKTITIADWKAQRAHVAACIADGTADTTEDADCLTGIDALIPLLETQAGAQAKREAHLKRQRELAEHSARAHDAAYRRIGREPPPRGSLQSGATAFAAMMASGRTGAVGVPMPGMADYFQERREKALRDIARLRRAS